MKTKYLKIFGHMRLTLGYSSRTKKMDFRLPTLHSVVPGPKKLKNFLATNPCPDVFYMLIM